MTLYLPFPEWISPTVIPGLPVRWYGVMYLVAFAVGYALTMIQLRERRLTKRIEVTTEQVTDLFFWTILGILLGGRILAATLYDTTGTYLLKPWLIFWPFDENMSFTGLQGMSYHGGLIGGAIAFVLYCRAKKIPLLQMGDMLAAAIPLGYTFGRLGNFINGELYGRITNVPWGVLFPHAERVPAGHPAVQRVAESVGISLSDQALVNLPRHPSQLYEALLEGVILWLVLWFVFRKRAPFDGFMIGVYLIGYSVARFIAEYFRAPDPGLEFVLQLGPANNPRWLLLSPLNLTTGQLLSVLMAAAGAALLLILRKRADATR